MKRALIVFLFSFGVFCHMMACDIQFRIVSDKKDGYKTGDEIVIEVQVKLIHRNCAIDMKQTKFTYDGLKILGATDWKEIQAGTYTRQIKAKVVSVSADPKLTVVRKCDRDGGYGVFTVKRGAA